MPAGAMPRDSASVAAGIVAVAPAREALAPSVPEPEPGAPPESAPPPPAADDTLKPPILREAVAVAWPPRTASRVVVELDVRVDERGDVSDAVWAGGAADSAATEAAIAAALRQRFWPALQNGRPVPVWCRQRFDRRGASLATP